MQPEKDRNRSQSVVLLAFLEVRTAGVRGDLGCRREPGWKARHGRREREGVGTSRASRLGPRGMRKKCRRLGRRKWRGHKSGRNSPRVSGIRTESLAQMNKDRRKVEKTATRRQASCLQPGTECQSFSVESVRRLSASDKEGSNVLSSRACSPSPSSPFVGHGEAKGKEVRDRNAIHGGN